MSEAGQFSQVISSAGRLTLTWPPFYIQQYRPEEGNEKKKESINNDDGGCLLHSTASTPCVCMFTLFNRYRPARLYIEVVMLALPAYLTSMHSYVYTRCSNNDLHNAEKRYLSLFLPTSVCSICSVTRLSTQHDPCSA